MMHVSDFMSYFGRNSQFIDRQCFHVFFVFFVLNQMFCTQIHHNNYHYILFTHRKVSRERSISTPSIINSIRDHRTFNSMNDESRFSRSQSPHTRTTGSVTPTSSLLDPPR